MLSSKMPKIALIHTWPEIKNAEFEVIARVKQACINCLIAVDIIDNNGVILESSDKSTISNQINSITHLFAISFHFESPKVFDVYTYIALWNPLEYYHGFDYQKSRERLSSHDDVLSCESDIADTHARVVFKGLSRRFMTPLNFYHNCPQPYLEPKISRNSSLFYIGINWERINNKRGRFHDLLVSLDKENMVSIYGPDIILGKSPWKGFQNYCGPLDFDGKSVVEKINKAGICLALSSKQHQDSGILSNRLFEGLAGGAVVITNKHPLVDKYFSDCVFIIDDENKSNQEILKIVKDIIIYVRTNVDEVTRRIFLGQEVLAKHFSLENSLNCMIRNHSTRSQYTYPFRDKFDKNGLVDCCVSIVADYRGLDAASSVNHFYKLLEQRYVHCDYFVLYDDDGAIKNLIANSMSNKNNAADKIKYINCNIGELTNLWRCISTKYFAFVREDEDFNSDHFASLVNKLEESEDSIAAGSGLVTISIGHGGKIVRSLSCLNFIHSAEIINCRIDYGFGRMLFKREALKLVSDDLNVLVKGREINAIAAAVCINHTVISTNVASFLWDKTKFADLDSQKLPLKYHREYIFDAIGREGLTSTKINQDDTENLELEIGKIVNISSNSEGARILGQGFSTPEITATWMDGRRGNIHFNIPMGSSDLCLRAKISIRPLPGKEYQRCTIILNRNAIGSVDLRYFPQILDIPIPRFGSIYALSQSIWFECEDAESPNADSGEIIDSRKLSILLWSVKLIQVENLKPVSVSIIDANTSDEDKVDPIWYLNRYTDVRDHGMDPISHYENHGLSEGRFPNAEAEERAAWL